MASSVIDEIHRRLTGHLACAFCITHRWMSSPSWPASPQLTMLSAWLKSCSMTANCFFTPWSSFRRMPKRGGIMGRALKAQLFHMGV